MWLHQAPCWRQETVLLQWTVCIKLYVYFAYFVNPAIMLTFLCSGNLSRKNKKVCVHWTILSKNLQYCSIAAMATTGLSWPSDHLSNEMIIFLIYQQIHLLSMHGVMYSLELFSVLTWTQIPKYSSNEGKGGDKWAWTKVKKFWCCNDYKG